MTIVVDTIESVQQLIRDLKSKSHQIALVPTMGNLHAGHLALIKEAKSLADDVLVSIFVNPLQFGENEDLARYPRTFEDDKIALEKLGVTAIFAPSVKSIYPEGQQNHTKVSTPGISTQFCGKSRPGHFDGVTTIVCKLFNIAQPDIAIFGQKDYQQLLIIKKMVADLGMPVKIIEVPTIRDHDGLALSSRNQFLSADEKLKASFFYKTLQNCEKAILQNKKFTGILTSAKSTLKSHGFKVDYLAICNAVSLKKITEIEAKMVILAAVYLGNTRLIDNLKISLHVDRD